MMYENEESIYSLIPPSQVKHARGARHKSKYDPKLAPTGSTFANHTTSKMVGNLNGEYKPQGGKHSGLASTKWGKPLGTEKPDPHGFTAKNTRTFKLADKRKCECLRIQRTSGRGRRSSRKSLCQRRPTSLSWDWSATRITLWPMQLRIFWRRLK